MCAQGRKTSRPYLQVCQTSALHHPKVARHETGTDPLGLLYPRIGARLVPRLINHFLMSHGGVNRHEFGLIGFFPCDGADERDLRGCRGVLLTGKLSPTTPGTNRELWRKVVRSVLMGAE